jgi:hypothetical protein
MNATKRCRVAWDAAGREVGVLVINGDESWIEKQRIDFEATAGQAIERIRDDAPGAEMALDAVEVLRDPETLVSLTIAALVQVAAVHAGLPALAAKLLGDAAGRLGRALLSAEPGGDRDPAVCYADLGYDYEPGTSRTWVEDPSTREAHPASRGVTLDSVLAPRRADTTDRAGRAARADRPGLVSPAMPQEDVGRAALRANPPPRLTGRDRGLYPPSRGGREGRPGRDDLDR